MMCIYKIENTINNKSYVGLTTNYKIRKTKHLYLLRHNKHENQHLQKAWNKLGESSFVFEILENCNTIEELNQKEIYWFNKLNSIKKGYNIKEASDCGKHTKETRLKISKPGSKHSNSILVESQILEIREKYSSGKYKQKELAEIYKVSVYSISNIVLYKSWKHVGGKKIKPNENNTGVFTKERLRKLTDQQILEIKDKLKNYKRGLYTKLGKEYGVHPTTISLIHTNKVWKNL